MNEERLCVHLHDITAERRVRERTDQLLRVSVSLGNALTTEEVAEVILDAAITILGASTRLLVLLSEDDRCLRLALAVGLED